jgi:hypothetical protein
MSFDPDKPYNALLLLPPKSELENKALAELKGAGDLIPNQGVLINAIILQEAKLLSEIENVVTRTMNSYRAPTCICSRNEHIGRICPKKPGFWTYPRNMSKPWTYRLGSRHGFDNDGSEFGSDPKRSENGRSCRKQMMR